MTSPSAPSPSAWPDNPFWEDAVRLYRRPGVEAACLDLQRRHGLDINLALLCCWAGQRGVSLDRARLAKAVAATASWQAEVVLPLRALRNRLRAKLVEPDPGSVVADWPELAGRLRQRALALEIEAERLSQLGLHRAIADQAPDGQAGLVLAWRNLEGYWSFHGQDRPALEALLRAAFPTATAAALDACLDPIDIR